MSRELWITPRTLGALAAMFALLVGGYAGVVLPRQRAIADLERQLDAVQAMRLVVSSTPPVTETERAMWRQNAAQVRARFVSPDDQRRVIVDVARLARASRFVVTDVQLQTGNASAGPNAPSAVLTVTLPFALPEKLAPNPGLIELRAQHGFRDLLDFLDRARRADTYVALHGLETRRVDNHLESDIRLVSLQWTGEN